MVPQYIDDKAILFGLFDKPLRTARMASYAELIYWRTWCPVVVYPAERVVWTSDRAPGADHDILSVADDGGDLWLEVKSTIGRDGRFRWSKREFDKALAARRRYLLVRVYEVDTVNSTIKSLPDPIDLLMRNEMRLGIESLHAVSVALTPYLP